MLRTDRIVISDVIWVQFCLCLML